MFKQLNFLRPQALSLKNFRRDLHGGLTADIVALHLALAFGVTSGALKRSGRPLAICLKTRSEAEGLESNIN